MNVANVGVVIVSHSPIIADRYRLIDPTGKYMPEKLLTASALLTNDVGLHARPSVKLTQLAKRFGASIEFALATTGPWVDAKSPVKVMRFRAAKGETLHFRAMGS